MKISTATNNTPLLSVIINSPIESVWQALRDKEKIAQWFGWNYAGLEKEINDIYFTNIKEDTSSTNQRSITVNGGDTFVLATQGKKTELQLVRRTLDGTDEDNFYDTITEGWVSFIEQLRFMLERQPDEARETIVTNKKLDKEAILTQLGLSGAQEGQVFNSTLEGHDLSGTVRFITTQQIGLEIDSWGPGLLIIQFSENMQLLTTYKLKDNTFHGLAEQWGSSQN